MTRDELIEKIVSDWKPNVYMTDEALAAAVLTTIEAAGMAMRNDVLEETIVKLQNMPRSHDNKSDYWSGYSNAINNAVDSIRALARPTAEKEGG